MKKNPGILLCVMMILSCGNGGKEQALGQDGASQAKALKGTVKLQDLSVHKNTAASKGQLNKELIRESFDLSSSTINYFSAEKTGETTGPSPEYELKDDGKPLKVEDFGPSGTLPRENRKPVIYASFSHSMVPLSKLGEPMHEHPGISIEPEIKGTFRWYGSRTISFEPDEVLPSQQEYTISISGKMQSMGKKKLKKPFSFSFTTEALDIASMRPGTYNEVWEDMENVPPPFSKSILLSFTEPVDMDHIGSFITVESEG